MHVEGVGVCLGPHRGNGAASPLAMLVTPYPMKRIPSPWFALPLMPWLVLPLTAQETAPSAPLGSTVFVWEKLEAKPTGVGERRDVARQPTATLAEFECHVSTLNPAQASHPPHTHPQEELIILREGTLDVQLNGTVTRVGPGSLFFFASNNPHAVQNHGEKPATYFVFNFSTAATAKLRGQAPAPAAPPSAIYDWQQLAVIPTAKGERRDVCDRATATLANFECHVTTLKPGETPHAPHHHPDEEILLLKEGQLDVTIAGQTTRATPGSIVFVGVNDEHGWRNSGETMATYYVMRLRTELTK
jgi:quercetin dioxygenase-like cupin family protein